MNKKILFLNTPPVSIITGGHKYDNYLFELAKTSKEFDVRRILVPYNKNWISKVSKPITNLKFLSQVRESDICFISSSESIYWSLLVLIVRLFYQKKQIILIHHHYLYMSFDFLRRPLYYIFEHLFLFLSSGIIIPSPYIYEITRKKIKRKYLYLIELTNEISFNQVTCIDKKQGNLLYVGSIEERKGLHYLLAALKMVPSEKYTLTIVGKIVDSKYKHKLDAVIQESSLNITFKGFVTDQELDDLYRSANVFVFPSLLEGYGIVLLEALSYGLPVIAFDNSAIPFTIKQNVNGILVKNKSIQAFAEALNRILSDDNLYIRLRAGALKSAQEARTFEQFTNDMRNFFLSLM